MRVVHSVGFRSVLVLSIHTLAKSIPAKPGPCHCCQHGKDGGNIPLVATLAKWAGPIELQGLPGGARTTAWGRTGSWLQMNRLSWRNNRLKFETSGEPLIILGESIEYASNE